MGGTFNEDIVLRFELFSNGRWRLTSADGKVLMEGEGNGAGKVQDMRGAPLGSNLPPEGKA